MISQNQILIQWPKNIFIGHNANRTANFVQNLENRRIHRVRSGVFNEHVFSAHHKTFDIQKKR